MKHQLVTRSISLPPDWLEAFTAEANHDGVTLSEWLRQAGRDRLRVRVRKRLSVVRDVGRPKDKEME